MADLSNVFGGPWAPPPEKYVAPPEAQLMDAMRQAGLVPPEQIYMDGKIHRFRSGTKGVSGAGDKPGWYLIFGDGIPAGRFGCWRSGVEVTWKADIGRRLTVEEEHTHTRRLIEAKALRDAELERKHEVASSTVEKIWTEAQSASADHPYLKRKGIGVHGSRITGDGRLVVPLYDSTNTLSSLQYIAHDGGKLYHPGGATGGRFWMLGTMDEPGPLYVAEGFATAATIHETTNRPCVVAYSASNIVPVTGAMREQFGAAQDIVIVADNDSSGVGQRYAEQACAKYGARMVMPPIEGDANDYVQAGHELESLLSPPKDNWLMPADDFSGQPAPISWLIKHWLQDNALMMVHGPSGGGKTFLVLDWCMRIASQKTEWCGNRVKNGNVVYLAGEGHHGLRGRIAAWRHYHKAEHLNMWVSKDGCDLNTPAGYQKVVEHIRSLPKPPSVIVVDTLHRFLHGDENSAQDTKSMLDACAGLMHEFGCSVILVHHTGVSEEAQHRARGSSAWRGALDIEISVIPQREDAPMQIVQRKSKDSEISEPLYANIEQVQIPGWFDEDNEPVKSAVLVPANAPVERKKDSKLEQHRKTFENAWWASGAEVSNGFPYVSRSGLMTYLVDNLDLTEASAKLYVKPSATGKLISELLIAEVIEPFEHGWSLVDQVHASAMMMRKNRG
jgi:phage/plasmid primase-like uncharacterized protein